MHLVPLVLLVLGVAEPRQSQVPVVPTPATETVRTKIVIDPKTPLADLLPQAPRLKGKGKTIDLFKVDLAEVPEVTFQEPLSPQLKKAEATYAIAHQLAKMRHLNDKKQDAFLEILISKRPDLQGLPFVMGKACRTTGDRAKLFGLVALGVRFSLARSEEEKAKFLDKLVDDFKEAKKDLSKVKAMLDGKTEEDKGQECKGLDQDLDAACVAALMQILAPESAKMRQGLVQFLAKTPHVDATRALARLALFSAEEEVRQPALLALKDRPKKDYQAILMQGFHYPLPEVAKRASVAVAYLKHKDLVPKLVDLLETPDPRLPILQTVNGKKVPVVRELVRVNHHRNCMLCHAPAAIPSAKAKEEKANEMQMLMAQITEAPVPLPSEPLAPPSKGYDPRSKDSQDILVRIDTTYLRQDFSLILPVANAAPWPNHQRFDFFVRSRVLTNKEAKQYRQQAPTPQANDGNPYQQAIVIALRELTGRQAGPNAQDWRNLLAKP